MSAVKFSTAVSSDDVAIRYLLKCNPIPGWVSLSYEREPSYFLASTVEGDQHITVIAREVSSDKIVGLFSIALYSAYVNGQVARIAYLGQLRIDTRYRNKIRYVRDGFEYCRQRINEVDGVDYFFTSIIDGNPKAVRLLTAGIKGLPRYELFSQLSTLAIPCVPKPRFYLKLLFSKFKSAKNDIHISSANESSITKIQQLLFETNTLYQFSPSWRNNDLQSDRCRGLHIGDFLQAQQGGELLGCLALWDQSTFKQIRVQTYNKTITRLRPLFNLLTPFTRLANLPDPGEELKQIYISHLAIKNNRLDVLTLLLKSALQLANERKVKLVILGLCDTSPFLNHVKSLFKYFEYRSSLYLLSWSGSAGVEKLDNRPVHVEVGML